MTGLVRLDLNVERFQRDLFKLESEQQLALLGTFRKIATMTWEQVYRDKGLHWEAIESQTGPNKQRLYSLRITIKFRAVAYRDGNFMRCVSLHPDHDSAYR